MIQKIQYRDIHVTLGGAEILKGISVDVPAGSMTGIIGPNGCGKSTLIKTTFGICSRKGGEILVDGTPVEKLGRRKLAACVGYVGQESGTVFEFSVREVVEMAVNLREGRVGNREEIVSAALDDLNIRHLEKRGLQTLSGGEKKLVFLARAIAQGVDTIILDEPTNHLDIPNQLFIMNYLKKSGKTVLIVLHDLHLASHYCDRLYLIRQGQNVCHGTPMEVLRSENVQKVFGVTGEAVYDETEGIDFRLHMD